ncbi:hypothetical protein EU527_15870 [Candidatus Thorarchaeota archaeon]|nr:MAG: hypothetical protein EU527_15870 [Candidatus Thorarchaeota archaeon]
MDYSEWITIQLDYSARIDAIIDYVIRRPAIPRWWDPVSRPHVAILIPDPISGAEVRYYLSKCGEKQSNGRYGFAVVDIDTLPEGTLLEVKFNAMKANLYKMERVGTVSCWRWLGRSQGLPDFDSDNSIYWDYVLDTGTYSPRDMILA